MDMMYRCLYITIFTIGIVTGQEFTVAPQNVHVMKGESVIITCTVMNAGSSGVRQLWREFYTNANAGIAVSEDGAILPDYINIFVIEGTYNLKLINADMKHGAKYSCLSVWAAGPPTAYAEVIVLDSNPICTSSVPSNVVIENDIITYTCEMRYNGKWAPLMEWKDKNSDVMQSNNQSTTNAVKYSIDITATETDNGQRYTCTTKFNSSLVPPPGANEATNVPDYTNTTTLPVLTVHYGPRRTKIQDTNGQDITDGKELYPGEVIKCVSESNPVSTYEWKNTTDNTVLGKQQEITVQESWLGDAEIACIVTNVMGPLNNTVGVDNATIAVIVMKGTRPTTKVITTKATTTPATTTTTTVTTTSPVVPTGSTTTGPDGGSALGAGAIAGIAVVAVIIIVIIIIIIVCCMRKNKKEKDVESTRPPKSAFQADHVRQANTPNNFNTNSLEKHPDISTIDRNNGPPPYNGDYSYDSQDPGYGTDPRQRNVENIVYADLALDDTPRSRKPIQVYEPTDYAEIKRV